MGERLGVTFDGGSLAINGKLDFYEFGRASYGFARFVATIEYFRRTGVVPRRITRAQDLDVIIEAPVRGSFPIDIIVPIATQAASALSAVPLEIFIQYVVSQVQRLFPSEEAALLQAAELQLRIDKEKTKQTKEETKRIEAMAAMVKEQNVSQRLALKLVQDAQKAQTKALSALMDVNVHSLRDKLELMERREKAFNEHLEKLEKIPSDKLVRLASKVRPQIAEMGLPLRKSAAVMLMTSGQDKRLIAKFDNDEIKDINSRILDEEVLTVEASFRAYDRDTGIGKFDLPADELRRVTFSVTPGDRTNLRPKVLAAINQDAVHTSVRFFKDKSGAVTSAIVQDILDLPD